MPVSSGELPQNSTGEKFNKGVKNKEIQQKASSVLYKPDGGGLESAKLDVRCFCRHPL